MSKENIKIYCRVKPVSSYEPLVEYEAENDFVYEEAGTVELSVPEGLNLKYSHNRADSYKFTFNQVFDQTAEQEEVYREVAQPVVENAFQGYNGTIFVYGQTASGKTYTILGEEATHRRIEEKPKKPKLKRRRGNNIKRKPNTVANKGESPVKEQPLTARPTPSVVDESSPAFNQNRSASNQNRSASNQNSLVLNPEDSLAEETHDAFVAAPVSPVSKEIEEDFDLDTPTENNMKNALEQTSEASGFSQAQIPDFPKEMTEKETAAEITKVTNSIQHQETPSEVKEEQANIPETEGIVPRTLSQVFSHFSSLDVEAKVHASYYEIYNEQGYDLLSGFIEKKKAMYLGNLTHIKAMTDRKQKLHLKNLSKHLILHEKDALELLEHGNANRQIAETHLNEASSRSHCIFTIYLTMKQLDSQRVLKSKVHLVDLAGSERIGKSHVTNAKLMNEGRNINRSLHHIQQVIVALSKQQNGQQQKRHQHLHVPFRNSTITLVLSDSLGGNSRTSMIATISVEAKNLEESLSTCRFAQQVAKISNRAVVNEAEDSDILIAQLRQNIDQLKKQLENANTKAVSSSPVLAKTRTPTPALPVATVETIDDVELLKLLEEYLKQNDSAVLDVGFNAENIQFCFNELKQRLLQQMEENQKLKQPEVKKSKACVIL